MNRYHNRIHRKMKIIDIIESIFKQNGTRIGINIDS